MATTTTTTNKPLNPRAQDLSPKGYNRAALFSGKALDFDGVNDKIDTDFAFTGSAASISFYLNWDNLGTTNVEFICEGQTNDALMVHLGGGAGTNGIRFSMNSSAALDSPSAVQGGWNHYVLTTNNATAALYVNGRLFKSQSLALGTATITSLDLAVRGNNGTFYLNGKLAGFKIFNTALTAAQVADLYLNPEKITPDGVATSALKLWLPMMEGAGASAYDGSGNGNDGTINGATWTAGVGAPVAQTALVSWNKGTNRLLYSEVLDNAAWQKANATITSNAATAPNGTTTADQITSTSTSLENYTRQDAGVGISAGTTLTTMAYAKKGTHTFFRMRNLFVNNGGNFGNAWFNLDTGAVATIQSGQTATMTAVGDGWYLCTLTGTIGTTVTALLVDLGTATTDGSNVPTTNGSTFVWGASNYVGAVGAPYIKTNATAQTSAVLVPEGLTAGASIFGTDIITPRNAFALNLDGASWAQVGDNASTDMVAEQTLETWFNYTGANAISASVLLGKWYVAPNYGYLLYIGASSNKMYYVFSSNGSNLIINAASTGSVSTGWNHLVAVKSATDVKYYINGVLDSTHSSTATLSNSAAPVQIGRNETGSNYAPYPVANPRIYNRALTAAEVLRNYNADKAKFGL